MKPRPRKIRLTPPAVHGGTYGASDGEHPAPIDFSVSLNAFGAAPSVAAALRAVADGRAWETYPDPLSHQARRAAGDRWSCPASSLTVGAGAAELIYAAAAAFVRAGDTVLVPRHAFAEYERACGLRGAKVRRVGASTTSLDAVGTGASADSWRRAVRRHRPVLVFICTPGNPGGRAWSRDALDSIADDCARVGAHLVIDQAYDAFTADPLDGPAVPEQASVLHLLSLTKANALAGVRVALAHGAPWLIAALDAVRPPWPVSLFTQAAVEACMTPGARAHVHGTTRELRSNAARLASALRAQGITTAPSATHILLADVTSGALVRRVLLADHGIRVRDCASFGLPRCIRVAARTAPDHAILLAALAQVMPGGISPSPDQ